MQYGVSTTGDVSNNDVAIGIENVTGQLGISCYDGTYPPNNYAIKFYYPDVITFQVHDLGMAGVQNSLSEGVFLLTGDPLDGFLRVGNTGNQNETAFTANYSGLPGEQHLDYAGELQHGHADQCGGHAGCDFPGDLGPLPATVCSGWWAPLR